MSLKTILRFEVLRELGKGSLGTVYRALDPATQKTVAIREICEEGLSPRLIAQIREKAGAALTLDSPNIVRTLEVGSRAPFFYVVTEYVEGLTLRKLMSQTDGFSEWDVIDITRQACTAIDHAHSRGLTHANLHPGNIVQEWDGNIKLMDYGLAVDAVERVRESTIPEGLFYVSPEQAEGKPLDRRSNLFSWGAILYEMVSGSKPFPGESAKSVLDGILQPLPPEALVTRVIPVPVLYRSIAKRADERYQCGSDMVRDLEKAKQPNQGAVTVVASPVQGQKAPERTPPPKGQAAEPSPIAGVPFPAVRVPAPVANLGPSVPHTAPVPMQSASMPAVRKDVALNTSTSPASVQPPAKPPSPANVVARTISPAMSHLPPAPPAPVLPKPQPAATSMAAANVATATYIAPAPVMKPVQVSPLDRPNSAPGHAGCAPDTNIPVTLPPISIAAAAHGASLTGGPAVSAPDTAGTQTAPGTFIVVPSRAASPGPRSSIPNSSTSPAKAGRLMDVIACQIQALSLLTGKLAQPERRLLLYGTLALVLVAAGLLGGYALHSPGKSAQAQQPAPPPPEDEMPFVLPPATPIPDDPVVAQAEETPRQEAALRRGKRKMPIAASPAPVLVAELSVETSPSGAQIQIDGSNQPFTTPHVLTGMGPGEHIVVLSKPGYAAERRAIQIRGGERTSLILSLAELEATIAVSSKPAGASVLLDGRDTGKLTPAALTVKRGQYRVAVAKNGFFEASGNLECAPGQHYEFSPQLTPMGRAEEIKSVGKFKKLFGGSAVATGQVQIRTNPKGAQILVNQHVLDKATPAEFAFPQGTYEIVLSMRGYKPAHRTVNVVGSGKYLVEEALQRE